MFGSNGASTSIGVASVSDRVNLNLVLGLIDPVDNPVRAATCRVVAVERLACSVRVDGDRSLDRLDGGSGHLKGQVLVDVAASLARQGYRVRLASGRVIAQCQPRCRRCSSSARTRSALKVSSVAKSSRD